MKTNSTGNMPASGRCGRHHRGTSTGRRTFIARSAYRIFDTRTAGTSRRQACLCRISGRLRDKPSSQPHRHPTCRGRTPPLTRATNAPHRSVNGFVAETTKLHHRDKGGANGQICFYTTNTTHLIWDRWWKRSTGTRAHANRLLDTAAPAPPLPGSVAK